MSNQKPYDESHDQQLEAVLRELPLRQPSDLFDHRIHTALSRRAFPWQKLLAAACFGGVCFWFGFAAGQQEPAGPVTPTHPGNASQKAAPADAPTNHDPGPRYTRIDAQWPVAQAQVLYDFGDGPPVRATIQDTIERTRWVDPENNRDIELTVPVRQVNLSRDTPY